MSKSLQFKAFTISKTFPLVTQEVLEASEGRTKKVIIIGSSCGGLIAARFVQTKQENSELVVGVVLLAPAIHIGKYMRNTPTIIRVMAENGHQSKYTKEEEYQKALEEWKSHGSVELLHGKLGIVEWSWKFMEDADENHEEMEEPFKIPCLVVQGGD